MRGERLSFRDCESSSIDQLVLILIEVQGGFNGGKITDIAIVTGLKKSGLTPAG